MIIMKNVRKSKVCCKICVKSQNYLKNTNLSESSYLSYIYTM